MKLVAGEQQERSQGAEAEAERRMAGAALAQRAPTAAQKRGDSYWALAKRGRQRRAPQARGGDMTSRARAMWGLRAPSRAAQLPSRQRAAIGSSSRGSAGPPERARWSPVTHSHARPLPWKVRNAPDSWRVWAGQAGLQERPRRARMLRPCCAKRPGKAGDQHVDRLRSGLHIASCKPSLLGIAAAKNGGRTIAPGPR